MNDRDSLLKALAHTYQRARFLVTSLQADRVDVPYHSGVNPPVWELGHSAFFYEYFILMALDGVTSFDPSMDDVWDSFQLDHKDRWLADIFPNLTHTLRYTDATFEKVRNRIDRKDLSAQELYLTKYSVFHQNMHIESKLWCRHTMGYPKPEWPQAIALDQPSPVQPAAPLTRLPVGTEDAIIPAGTYVIGMPAQANSIRFATDDFAFDNEKPRFEIELQEFAIARQLVTNEEYLAFVEDAGYQRPELWSQGGQRWLRKVPEQPEGLENTLGQVNESPRHPVYWKNTAAGWLERFYDQWLPLEQHFPVVHISYWEAEAWCRWANRRLPSECEWEAAALGNQPGQAFKKFPWGNEMQQDCADLDGILLARLPVNALPEGDSASGCRQLIGTVWEWTADQFFPYDGFIKDMYPFMSTLQFGDHKVCRGGSCATSSMLIRGTYRQAYLPGRADVFTGFRTCAL